MTVNCKEGEVPNLSIQQFIYNNKQKINSELKSFKTEDQNLSFSKN